jgi:transcriptional regulator with PAS, ATPase and Fis domain
MGDNKTRKADVHIISATNADLEEDVKSGKFREDLLYRLNVIQIEIPPLRDRTEDAEGASRSALISGGSRAAPTKWPTIVSSFRGYAPVVAINI